MSTDPVELKVKKNYVPSQPLGRTQVKTTNWMKGQDFVHLMYSNTRFV